MIYADHAATTRLSPLALAAMTPFLQEEYGNPSSAHALGRAARQALVLAREKTARCLGCAAREITFTSGGSEADNQALLTGAALGAKQNKRHLVSTAFEHPAVLETLRWLETVGFEVTLVPPGRDGVVKVEALAAALRPDTALMSVMSVNNEVGTLQPAAEAAALCRQRGVLFHTDAVQAAGHLPLNFKALGVDFLAISAHKFGGPKGVGALLCRAGIEPVPLIRGGGQERGARAGTENATGIAGLAAALEESCRGREQESVRLQKLQARLIRVLSALPGAHLSGKGAPRTPGTVHFCFEGIEGETLVLLLDERGICASAGSACSSGATQPSHVLAAMGLSPALARGALRLSLGPENTEQEAEAIGCAVAECIQRLRGIKA